MREERGQVSGNLIISEPYTLWGSIGGDVVVIDGGKFYCRGAIYGNLTVEDGGRVHIFGQVQGDVTLKDGTKLVHSGVVGGDIHNLGGRLFVDRQGKVNGKVKAKKGETKVEGTGARVEH